MPPNPFEPPSMLVLDPPEHTRMRRPVAAAFTPQRLDTLRDRIEAAVTELLDPVPFHGSIDLITSFASQLPAAIISEILGFPEADRAMFLDWGQRMAPLFDAGIPWSAYRGGVGAIDEMSSYLRRHTSRLRNGPDAGIFGALVDTDSFNDRELEVTAGLLLLAGFATTVNLIGNGAVHLLQHRDQLALLRAQPDLWSNAIEEILRYDPPAHATVRMALTDVEIRTARIRRGTPVMLSLVGANRDPDVFPDPDRFDITRTNAGEHLSFATGIHACLGAGLARMEAGCALRALFERFPDLALADTPQRSPLFSMRGYSHIPVTPGNSTRTPDRT